jgi:nucleoside-diphosphate-sugar epimerase
MGAEMPFADDDLERVRSIVGGRWEGLRGRRLLVTGATGFIGRWLLGPLLDANMRLRLGCEVSLLTRRPQDVRLSSPWLADAPCVRLLAGDVRQLDRLDGANTTFDYIIHAAADVSVPTDPLETFTTCVEGTRQVLELARQSKPRSTLLVSSGAVYGPPAIGIERMQEDAAGGPAPFRAASAYAEGKRAAECLAAVYAERFGLRLSVARCFAFVGPHLPLDGSFAIGNFLRDALAGRTIVLRGDGTAVRSYLHASDMSGWLWSLLFDGEPGIAYNVGSDVPVTLGNLATLINRLAGSDAGSVTGPPGVPGLAPDRYVPDVARITTHLKLPPPLPLAASIDRTLRWHRSNAASATSAMRGAR